VLSEHLRVSTGELDNSVFPDSATAKGIEGLFRA
jgi:hypothetical protein